jgi:hypothetical protein
MAAQKATRVRRQLAAAVDADHAALRERQEELERLLLTAPATSWVEAVAKARYLLSGPSLRTRRTNSLATCDPTSLVS